VKVAIFASYLPPHVGGIEAVTESQATGLAARGEEVVVVTSACGSTAGVSRLGNSEVHRIPAWNYFEKKMGAVFPIFSPTLVSESYRAIKTADIVHAHDSFYLTSLAAAVWAKVLHKPLILTQHVDLIPHPSPIVGFVQKAVYATTGRFIQRSSSRILVLNSRVERFLVGKGVESSKITFLPNCVDTNTYAPADARSKLALREKYQLSPDKVLALFVGRFVPKKGFAKLLHLRAIPNVEIVFVGGDAPPGHARADQHFLGVMSRLDMPDIYKMCDIFVLPSQGEGFPVTVQEAMASGLPAIVGDDPAYGPYDLDSSLLKLVSPDTESISASLALVAADPELRADMSNYSRLYALKNFDSTAHVEVLLDVYRRECGQLAH
jgi:D-inositol-3-phosphate glycosyltransferase